jgi:uncharacterized small protein (DUF1192 family)
MVMVASDARGERVTQGGATICGQVVNARELSQSCGRSRGTAKRCGNFRKIAQGVPAMDWDEARPKPATGAAIGENLSTLSVAELETRIGELEKEIERVRAELMNKRKHEDAASALFKSK